MAIAEHLYRYRGMHVSPDHIIVGAGTEYLYSRLLQLLGKNAKFGVENPGYRKITKLYDVGGVTWDYVDIDGQGMKVEQLDQKGITVAHVSPEHHFPIGLVMPVGRRQELLRWAAEEPERYNDMFDAALRNTRIEMSPAERRQFYEKHIRHMTLTIDENGNVSIELKRG